ncbi:hypothetical protein MOC27_16535 [Bacillus inaquosorum]|uniref:Uncharacterized protein n=1 Tax=Bacillus vallismortis TaxID=72361 RepID=A0AAP3CF58_BACVA|nr:MULTISPECIES: hypothetical protein [Bacillus subtilis group]MCY9234602.1 hypothetical protein [Bacillus spizizenii]MCY8248107.1 hypothetical protein [Bacillus inaquosorum]MCY8251315.1 hypothetical protein [Bacillus inaquosorum]MCY8315331.1 hypothetical protein [Bacillus vallismortis]MCY8706292.1 hypothetical protein [Bacillus inaquosorum]
MTILFSFLFILYLLGTQIPLAEATKLISGVLNSKFITSAITSWPLAIVIIAFAFRKGILDILRKRKIQLEAGGGNGVKVDIGEVMDEKLENVKETTAKNVSDAKQVNDNKNVINFPELTMTMNNLEIDKVFIDALSDPEKSINDTWDLFSTNLSKIIAFVSENTTLTFECDTLHAMDVLYEDNKISKITAEAVKDLFDIFRLAAIKGASANVDKVAFARKAKEYYVVCVDTLERLRSELSESLAEDLQS